MQRKMLPDGKFRDRLESVREKAGLSPAELARLSGLTPTAISRYRSGDRTPNVEELLRLSTALGVTMEWFLTGYDDHEGDHSSVVKEAEAIYKISLNRANEAREIANELERLAQRLKSICAA